MVPIVAAVPNAVPVRNDTSAHSRNAARSMTGPEQSPAHASTTNTMVPLARHEAVSIPMRTKVTRIFPDVRTPDTAAFAILPQLRPRVTPYPKKRANPARSGAAVGTPASEHPSSPTANTASTTVAATSTIPMRFLPRTPHRRRPCDAGRATDANTDSGNAMLPVNREQTVICRYFHSRGTV